MRIESRTTWDRRFRTSLFLVMCVGMSGWFAYDGFKGYPAKNLEWARQKLPEKPDDLKTNPLALEENLQQVREGTTQDELTALLGEPALVQPKRFRFVGRELVALVEFGDEGKVRPRGVRTEKPDPDEKPEDVRRRVTRAIVERIKEGMSETQVTLELGAPAEVREKTLWFVGPAAYGAFQVADGKVAGRPDVQVSHQPSEVDITLQKILAAILAVFSVGMAVKLYRVLRTRVVVDDTGLTMGSRHVAWEAMAGLKTDRYKQKGWVDLHYVANGVTRSLRLDSYHIDRFHEIVTVICERKVYAPPLRPPGGNEPDESPLEPTADGAPDEQS